MNKPSKKGTGALGGTGKEVLYNIITKAYETGEIPKDFEKCIIRLLKKKKKAERYEERWPISLISHASKVLTKIVHKKIENKAEGNVTEDQFGFWKIRGTKEAILCLRIIKNNFRLNKPLYIAFVDLEKAFYNVRWIKRFGFRS